MKKLFIWYHRRRAAYHEAMRHHTTSPFHRCYDWHVVWAKWHRIREQIITEDLRTNNNTAKTER